MAIFDEYKQAIQDVLDGRAPEPPKPSEFPDTDDRLTAQYFAAAATEVLSNRRFIVNCTPTDGYTGGGTADKTLKEINDAYSAGKEILFRLPISSSITLDLPATYVHHTVGASNVVFGWMIIGGSAIIRYAFTSNTDNTNTYSAQSIPVGS